MNSDRELPLLSNELDLKRHKTKLNKLIKTSQKGLRFESEFGCFMLLLDPTAQSERPFKIKLRSGIDYQIDVLSIYDEVVVVTECKEGENHNIPDEIYRITENAGEISNILRKSIKGEKRKNFVFILAYCDKIPSVPHFNKAKRARISLIDRKILESYLNLAQNLKKYSRDIIFSDWLKGKPIKMLPQKSTFIPTTKGLFGNVECYNFLMSPFYLKKLCYVHRRHIQHTLEKKGITYQRLIKHKKIKEIRKFLNDGRFFPSSVLINFDESINFQPSADRPGDIEKHNPNITNGWLTLPKKHGCAIVIDGQHRIFGYSGLDELSKEHSLSVIAFSKLDYDLQAKLFAEINENQTPINKDVLWDLYEDILPESEIKYKVSTIVKKLNRQSTFFKGKIFIPSESTKSRKYYPLYMNRVCQAIVGQKYLFKQLLEYDDEKYFNIIDRYFSQLLVDTNIREDWEQTERSFVKSNNGLHILSMVLNTFYDFILRLGIDTKYIEKKYLLEKLDEFTSIVAKAVNGLGFKDLRGSLKSSADASKKEMSNKLIIKAGEYSSTFKEISKNVYLQYAEGKHHEFKEFLYYDEKNEIYSDEYFHDAILGTISAYINAKCSGDLWIGVTDDKKKVGLNFELNDKFKNSSDEMIKFIENKIETSLITSGFDKHNIEIERYFETPLIIKINVPESKSGVSVVVSKNKTGDIVPRVYRKTNAGKRKIKNFKEELEPERAVEMLSILGNFIK